MREELFYAVALNPEDEGARTVLADALQLDGDPRGLAMAGSIDPDILEAAKDRWETELGENVHEIVLARGMPVSAEIWISADDDRALIALDHAPIRNIKLRFDEDCGMSADSASPVFARDSRTTRIASLDLGFESWGESNIRELLAAKLPALRRLWIGDYDIHLATAQAITTNPTLALEDLGLFGDSYADFDDGIAVLAGSPRSASLREIAATNCSLNASAGYAIGKLHDIRRVDLSSGSNTPNRIGDGGLLAILQSPLSELERLVVSHNHITDHSLLALANPYLLPKLNDLALNGNAITNDGVTRLIEARAFDGLYLGGCREVGDAVAFALASSPHALKLRSLNLHGTAITQAGIDALIASPLELTYLVVSNAWKPALVERFGAAVR